LSSLVSKDEGKGYLKVDFSAEEALKIARSLAFPRAVGSTGEEAAASFVEGRLRDSGYVPEREEFSVALSPWTVMKGLVFSAILIAIGARGLAAFSPVTSSILMLSLVTFLLFYSSFWLKVVGSGSTSRWLIARKDQDKLIRSQNIVASLPAREKTEQHLYLTAHYDSKSQSLSLLQRAFFLFLSGLASLWLGFSYLWSSKETLGSFPSLGVDFPLAFAFFGMIPFLFLKTANRSSGGLDNAGSLGILLHLAEGLRQKRPLRSKVTFLFTGAEELGLQGAFAYLRQHKKAIEREKSYFVNLDCVGVKGRTRIFSRRGPLPIGRESPFASGVKEIAKPFKIGTMRFSFGFLMDHQAFMEKGYQAISLACASGKIMNIHTARDTADQLDHEGVEEVGKLILALIHHGEKLDKIPFSEARSTTNSKIIDCSLPLPSFNPSSQRKHPPGLKQQTGIFASYLPVII